jgi:hypothetical protein
MTRCLIAIGVALVDAGAPPATARWIVELLGSTRRAYLPRPEVAIDRHETVVRFQVGDRALALAVARPGAACWCRTHPDGTQDRAALGPAASGRVAGLFDWLLDDAVART